MSRFDHDTEPAGWCVGYRRPPHVIIGVRPRKPDALPMCDRCDLARRRQEVRR